MTNEKKIEKLAKWLGCGIFPDAVTDENGWRHALSPDWNPLTNIADADMLVQKAYKQGAMITITSVFPAGWRVYCGLGFGAEATESTIPLAVSNAFLEVIND